MPRRRRDRLLSPLRRTAVWTRECVDVRKDREARSAAELLPQCCSGLVQSPEPAQRQRAHHRRTIRLVVGPTRIAIAMRCNRAIDPRERLLVAAGLHQSSSDRDAKVMRGAVQVAQPDELVDFPQAVRDVAEMGHEARSVRSAGCSTRATRTPVPRRSAEERPRARPRSGGAACEVPRARARRRIRRSCGRRSGSRPSRRDSGPWRPASSGPAVRCGPMPHPRAGSPSSTVGGRRRPSRRSARSLDQRRSRSASAAARPRRLDPPRSSARAHRGMGRASPRVRKRLRTARGAAVRPRRRPPPPR